MGLSPSLPLGARPPGNAGVLARIDRRRSCHLICGRDARVPRTRRAQDAVPAQAAPWGEIRQEAPRTDPTPWNNAVRVGVENISKSNTHYINTLRTAPRGPQGPDEPGSQGRFTLADSDQVSAPIAPPGNAGVLARIDRRRSCHLICGRGTSVRQDPPFPGRRAQERSREACLAKTPPRTCLEEDRLRGAGGKIVWGGRAAGACPSAGRGRGKPAGRRERRDGGRTIARHEGGARLRKGPTGGSVRVRGEPAWPYS